MNEPYFKNPPEELLKLYHFLEDFKIQDINKNYKHLQNLFNNYIKYLDKKYEDWYSKKYNYTDEHIGNQIFISEIHEKDSRSWARYQLIALIETSKRIIDNILKFYKNKTKEELLQDEIKLMWKISLETIIFLDYAHFCVNRKYENYGFGRKNVLNSAEIFSSSSMLLRGVVYEKSFGRFMIPSVSIFLIRQALEIRLKNALGISAIKDNKGKMLKDISFYDYIEIIFTSNDDVQLSVDKILLSKIYKWTNYYIHAGIVSYIWQIEWALRIIAPLFKGSVHGNNWYAFGSIKIKRKYYDDIESKIKSILSKRRSPDSDIYVERLKNPECIII